MKNVSRQSSNDSQVRNECPARNGTRIKFVLQCCSFLGLFWVIWALLYGIHVALPGLKSGAAQVVDAKRDLIAAGSPLGGTDVRVIVFGNSRALAGFVPELFDELVGPGVSSFNLALPGRDEFGHEYEVSAQWNPPPTHVLITRPWKAEPEPSILQKLRDDDELMKDVFPFRKLPRNAALFLIRARTRGGLLGYYEKNLRVISEVKKAKGYHFIESQSHFAGDRLPSTFSLASDDPVLDERREFVSQGTQFQRLVDLARQREITLLIVPDYRRVGERAKSSRLRRPELEEVGISILGPEYWLYENEYFSDPVHLNPKGAERYTRDLAEALRSSLKEKQ